MSGRAALPTPFPSFAMGGELVLQYYNTVGIRADDIPLCCLNILVFQWESNHSMMVFVIRRHSTSTSISTS